jgi:hypothetical protein
MARFEHGWMMAFGCNETYCLTRDRTRLTRARRFSKKRSHYNLCNLCLGQQTRMQFNAAKIARRGSARDQGRRSGMPTGSLI